MIPSIQIADSDGPVRKSAQRLRWFVKAFEAQLARIEAQTGNRFVLDHGRLSGVFLDWLAAFNAQKPEAPEDRPAYVGFAAGLMLKALIERAPLTLEARPEGAELDRPAWFWPEGYAYVAFCLNVRGLVLEKDFQAAQVLSADLDDPRTWWSFRENVAEDPALAIAFLDHFAGERPDWNMPDLFRGRRFRSFAPGYFDAIDADLNGA